MPTTRALSDGERQQIILRKTGDVEPVFGDPLLPEQTGGVVGPVLPLIWRKYADYETVDPNLRDLYVEREALAMVIAVIARKVDVVQDQNNVIVRQSQEVKARQDQMADLVALILQREKIIRASGIPLVSALTTITLSTPPLPGALPQSETYRPDANSPVYSGSPYWRDGRSVGIVGEGSVTD